MKRKEAEKIALEILTEAQDMKQAWNDYCETKMLVVPMDVLSALVVPDRNIKVIEGELRRKYVNPQYGHHDEIDDSPNFISDAIGLCGGSLKVRITIENLEAKP